MIGIIKDPDYGIRFEFHPTEPKWGFWVKYYAKWVGEYGFKFKPFTLYYGHCGCFSIKELFAQFKLNKQRKKKDFIKYG